MRMILMMMSIAHWRELDKRHLGTDWRAAYRTNGIPGAFDCHFVPFVAFNLLLCVFIDLIPLMGGQRSTEQKISESDDDESSRHGVFQMHSAASMPKEVYSQL